MKRNETFLCLQPDINTNNRSLDNEIPTSETLSMILIRVRCARPGLEAPGFGIMDRGLWVMVWGFGFRVLSS